MGGLFDFIEKNFGGILSGVTNAAGYDALLGKLQGQQTAVGNALSGVVTDVETTGAFKPWTVRSGIGSTSYNPATGTTQNTLTGTQQQYANQQGQGAANMYGRVMQDPAARESDIFGRIRAMQAPDEQRAYESMNANLFGSGRGGMSSEAYGGSPEQFAFGKAQAEARNAASLSAMNQAQQEMQNYANIGQSMFNNQYTPWQQLQGFSGQGIQNQQLYQNNQQNLAGLLAQL
jgi:hypothetical protein